MISFLNSMRKITLLFILFNQFCIAQDWVKTIIPGVGTINFPEDAEIYDQDGTLVYKVENDDAYYFVTIVQIDERYATEIENNLDEYYAGNLEGVENATGGKVTFKETLIIDGKKAMDARISGVVNPELPSLLFKRFVYKQPFNVSAEFMPKKTDELAFTELKDTFFNSLALEVRPEEASLSVEDLQSEQQAFKKGYAIGYVIGRIAFFVFFFVILGLIVFFVVRAFRPKTKPQVKPKSSKKIIPTRIICTNCGKDNNPEAKYCSQCGFALPKT